MLARNSSIGAGFSGSFGYERANLPSLWPVNETVSDLSKRAWLPLSVATVCRILAGKT